MPLSKRAQKVTLSKTQKKGRARKESLVDEVRGRPPLPLADAQNSATRR